MLETPVGCEGLKFIAVILWSIVRDEHEHEACHVLQSYFSAMMTEALDDVVETRLMNGILVQ